MRSNFPQLYAVSLRVLAVLEFQSQTERTFSVAGKTLRRERSSLSSLRAEIEIYIPAFLLDKMMMEEAKARAGGVIG
jgi:hypothetical protein